MTTDDSIQPGPRTDGAHSNKLVPPQLATTRQPIPFLKSDEEQLAKIRRQLEAMFRELRLVQDVIMVCREASGSEGSDLDDEVEHVLRRCGSDRMHTVLKTLTQIVERFGGTTEMSEERQGEDQ